MKLNILITILFLSGTATAQIADNYPYDSLIQNDQNVIFAEMFEQSSVSVMLTSSGMSYLGVSGNLSFDSSVPGHSHGTQSCKLTTLTGSSQNETSQLRKVFSQGIADSVFIRYYIKYNDAHTFHHSGVWLGGTNPAYSCFPCVYPGSKAAGDSGFQVGTEIRNATIAPQSNGSLGFYNYWTGMHPYTTGPNAGKYYGNEFVHSNGTIDMRQWNCIEVRLKLNSPVNDSNGELTLWINGNKIAEYGKGFPTGTWNQAIFNQGSGVPFQGFQWRTTSALKFTYFWLQNYADNNASYPSANDILFDHVVVAKSYIGPIKTLSTYTIVSTAGSNGTVSPSGNVSAMEGSSKSFVIKPDAGYHVDSLIVDGNPVSPDTVYTFINVQAGHTLRAVFAPNLPVTFTIVAVAGSNGIITPSGTVGVMHGASKTFSVQPAPGYHVDSLLVDGIPVTPDTVYTFVNVQSGHTLRAVFAINTYQVTATNGANGSITPAGTVIVNHLGSVSFTFTPVAGYQVDSLWVDGIFAGSPTSYTFSNVQAAHTLHVTFRKIPLPQFVLTASAGNGGSITPSGSVTVTQGDTLTFLFTPDAQHQLDSVWVDNMWIGSPASYTFQNITSAHSIHSSFRLKPNGVSSAIQLDATVYPNPASGQLTVRCSSPIQQLVLTDPTGRCVKEWEGYDKKETELQLPALATGIYALRIVTHNGNISRSVQVKFR